MWLSVRRSNRKTKNQTYRNRLKERLEPDKIALEVVRSEIHVLLGHCRIDHQACWRRRSHRVVSKWWMDGGVGEGVKREVSPNVVRGWIFPDYVFEPASEDLKIVGGVTPTTDAGT